MLVLRIQNTREPRDAPFGSSSEAATSPSALSGRHLVSRVSQQTTEGLGDNWWSVETGRRCPAFGLQRRPCRKSKLVRMDEQWGDAVMAKVVARRNPSVTKLTDGELRKLLGQITAMAVEHVAIDAVKPNPRNAKQHPEQQVLLIAENIRKRVGRQRYCRFRGCSSISFAMRS
jgi:hypothetical protein